jgi:hypothetical protein
MSALKVIDGHSACPGVQAIGSLYPRKISRYVIVRAPSWFETVFSFVSQALPAGARDNIVLCGTTEALEAQVERSAIPKAWGGDSDRPIGDSDEERALKAHVASRSQAGGAQ